MTIAIKGVNVQANETCFDIYCFESDSYETIASSQIRECVNLKTGRRIQDLGRRYTVNRLRY